MFVAARFRPGAPGKLFDPSLLTPLLQEICQAIPNRQSLDPEFQGLYERLMAFDGSYFRVPAQVLWALHEKSNARVPGRQVRLNLSRRAGTSVRVIQRA